MTATTRSTATASFRRRDVTWCALGALLLTVAPGTATAQITRSATSLDCDIQFLFSAPQDTLSEAWRPLHPSARTAAWSPMMAEGRWLELVDSVRTSLAVDLARHFPESLARDPRGARLRARLDALRDDMASLVGVPTVEALKAKADTLRRVGPAIFRPSMSGGDAVFFRGTADSLRITNVDPVAVRRTLCYHSALASFIADRFTVDARAYATTVLATKEARWHDYFDRGYSQLPWELYLNSRAARNAGVLDPPTRQLILLHPSPSVQVAGSSWRRLESHEAIAVEPLGFIWYHNDYRDYFGISSVVVFANSTGTSVGPFLHFGRVAKVGYTFPIKQRGEASDSRPGGILVSVDLYKYLSDRSAQARQVVDGLRKQVTAAGARN